MTRPDLDKLTRAVLDSLVYAGMIKDDSLVYNISAHKRFCVCLLYTSPSPRD